MKLLRLLRRRERGAPSPQNVRQFLAAVAATASPAGLGAFGFRSPTGGTHGFVQFIVTVTDPFYRPFRGIVSSPSTDGGHTLLVPLIIAIVVYLLLHLAINGLLRIVAHRKTAV